MKHLQNLHIQDNLGTADPIFVVFEKERIWNVEDACHYEWWTEDRDYQADDEEVVKLDALKKLYEETAIDGNIFEKKYYEERDRFVTACFTRQGAEDYLAWNGHNLARPFIYVSSLYRNQEMIDVRQHLMATHRPQSPWQPDPNK